MKFVEREHSRKNLGPARIPIHDLLVPDFFWDVLSQQISLQLRIAFLWLTPLKLPNFSCVWSILHTSLSLLLETCHHWSLMSWAWGVRATLASSLFSSLTEVVSLVSPALPLHVGSAWVMGVWHNCISCYHTNAVPLFLSLLLRDGPHCVATVSGAGDIFMCALSCIW